MPNGSRKTRLELTWIGKENWPRLGPRGTFYFLTVTFAVPIDDDDRGGSKVLPLC